jgi:hypothetical protein
MLSNPIASFAAFASSFASEFWVSSETTAARNSATFAANVLVKISPVALFVRRCCHQSALFCSSHDDFLPSSK